MIHGPNIPGSYAILFFTALDLTSITSHIHNWVLFLLWFCLFILSGVISPLTSSGILGIDRPGEFIFQCPILLPFLLFMGFSRQEYWSGLHSLLQWTTYCQTSPPWPVHLGWPHMAWLSFIELDKAVVLVWLDWLVFWEYGFSVLALWCPLATPTILLGFLFSWTWDISLRLLQQSAATAPYLGREVSPHHLPSWPWMWSSSSWPSCNPSAMAPWTWGRILPRKRTGHSKHYLPTTQEKTLNMDITRWSTLKSDWL